MNALHFRPLPIAVTLAAIVALVALAPLSLYALGLSEVDGRPGPPLSSHSTPADQALLARTFRTSQPTTVEQLTPWAYVTFILEDPKQTATAGGVDAAWVVARHYNAHHLKKRSSMWWHLSGAALTIWITRHWTSDQVLSAAAALVRQSDASNQHSRSQTDR
jgi:hypothetical protein